MINQDLLFSALNSPTPGPDPIVKVFLGGTGIHTITGPVPLVDISKNINYTEGGAADSITHQITLTGKVFKPGAASGIGFNNVASGVKGLENFLLTCLNSTFSIECSGTKVYEATGVRVVSFNADKTTDNWTQSADYTIGLEYKTGPNPSDPDDQVENRSDSWSIEPMDDIIYTLFTYNVDQKPEWSNPQMKPLVPTVSNPVPGTAVGGGSFATGENTLKIISIPQFKISRRLSAKGLIPMPPSGATGCISATGLRASGSLSYISAKRWVEKQRSSTFQGGNISTSGGMLPLSLPYVANLTDGSNDIKTEFDKNKIWLYNHTQSINIDINGGTYESNDTWTALPTGIPYTEQYSIETSTNDQFTKTVRVAGNIQGLSVSSLSPMSGGTGVFPTGTGNNLSLGYSTIPASSLSIGAYELPDVSGTSSRNTNLSSSRYLNALSGWLYDIKPYLYRRASLAINSSDRTLQYTNPALGNTPKPPNNPIYSKETLLAVIPVSTTEGHDPRKGTISYSYEYNNRLNLISGVISENITITNDAPSEIVSETQIIGRARGPLLQKTGYTATRKSVSIEVVVMPPTGIQDCFINSSGCPLFTGGFVYTTIQQLIEGLKPFGIEIGQERIYNDLFGQDFVTKKNRQGIVYKSSDNDSWNPTGGRYTRTVSWIYQQCSETKYYLDH